MKNNLHEAFADEFKNIGKIIEHVGVCMMTTAAPTGGLCSRPMYVQELDVEGNLWFFASNRSHVIEEIRKVPVVSITFASSEKSKFISASGIAYEAFDRTKMEELWTPALKAWFEDGLDSPDLTLLKVDMQEIEYWDSPHSPVVKMLGFVKSLVSDEPYRPGHYEKIDLRF